MRYLLDTNTCIEITRGKNKTMAAKMESYNPHEVGISILTHYELLVGVNYSKTTPLHKRRIEVFLSEVEVVEFSAEESAAAATIKAQMIEQGRGIGEIDCCIAGTAIYLDLILVTNDADFSSIRNLKRESWV